MAKNVTRRQHHVWRRYIEGWASEDKVWCLMLINRKVVHTNPINLGVEGDFYKLGRLNEADRAFVKEIIAHSPVQGRKVLNNFLRMFDGEWLEGLRSLLPPDSQNALELNALVDEYMLTAEEQYHGGLENDFVQILNHLKEGDASVVADDNRIADICRFVALQWFRTKTLRTAILKQSRPPPGVSMRRVWPVLSHIFATNVGGSLFLARHINPLRLVENASGVPFITGDQPVVNLQSMPKEQISPEHFSLYWPLSSTRALFIDDHTKPLGLPDLLTSAEEVKRLNWHMAASADMQVYASSRECLIHY